MEINDKKESCPHNHTISYPSEDRRFAITKCLYCGATVARNTTIFNSSEPTVYPDPDIEYTMGG